MSAKAPAGAAAGKSRRSLRVCIASPDIVGPIRNGGVGTACTALAQELAKVGHRVTLFYTSNFYENGNAQTWIDFYKTFGIAFVPLEAKVQPPPHLNPTIYESDPAERSYRVYAWLRDQEFDVIHFPDYIGLGYFTALAKSQGLHFQNTVICTTAHAPTMWARLSNASMINDLPIVLRDRMERGLVAASDVLISPSRYMIDWMAERDWTLPKHQLVLPNLMPTDKLEAAAVPRADGKPPAARKVDEIVFFGRIEPRKGLLIFCDAIDRMAKDLTADTKITFLGKTREGEYGKELLSQRFRKWQARWQVIDDLNTFQARDYLLGEGRLAVIPSLADNSPYTVLECLTWGVPFIASRVGGVAELVHPEDCDRILFKPTPNDLAQRLRSVLSKGIIPGRMSFGHDQNLAAYLDLHEGLLAEIADANKPRKQAKLVAEPKAPEPLASVALLHFERPVDLPKAVASLQRQTYKNLEVVLVDNGTSSSAGTETLKALEPVFAERNWKILRLDQNMYEPYARNQAAAAARGKYVLFMDDDNVAKEKEVETFVRVAEKTGTQVLTCFLDHFDTPDPPADESQALKRFIPIGDAGPVGLIYNGYGDVNCFAEREAFLRIGGFVEDGCFNHAEDWRFLARAYAAGLSMSVVPEALAWYRTVNQPYGMSWRKRDRSGALMRAASVYFEHAPAEVQPFVLLAQGLFWKAQESQSKVRDLESQCKTASNQARSLGAALEVSQGRYRDLLAEYQKLEQVMQALSDAQHPEAAVLQRMRVSVDTGRRRHFGLNKPLPHRS